MKDVIFLEKAISKIDISSDVIKGNSKQLIICPKCGQRNFATNRNNLTYSKIKTVICTKCRTCIQIGDIFNFDTGTKLNKRNNIHNPDVLDNYIWDSKKYDIDKE